MVEKNKILFVLNNQEYFRNYITSGALSRIKKECFLLIEKNISQELPGFNKERIIRYSYPQNKAGLHWHLFNINTRRFSTRSKTFQFRFARMPKRLQQFYSILALPLIYYFVRFVILQITDDQNLSNLIKKIKPSLILIPSSGFEGVTFEIIKIAQKSNIPTCLLIDNWDNLCSKTIFTRKPDYLAVWGKQSVEMAQRIHRFEEKKIFILGTPRFVDYFKSRRKIGSPYPFNYALFAGNALPFDELTTLKKLDELIETSGRKITIIYRPHPWRHPRRCADTFFEYDFKNVKLDLQAREYYKKELGDNYSPSLEYYPQLLTNMEFMICPLSTMLIEGLLFKKRVFVLTYDDGVHFTNPKNAFRFYEHFEGIEKLIGVTIIDKFKDLKSIMNNQETPKDINKRSDLNYYLTLETKNYPKNLKLMTDKIIQE